MRLTIIVLSFTMLVLSHICAQDKSFGYAYQNERNRGSGTLKKSYYFISFNYEMFYFLGQKKSTEANNLKIKVPLNNNFGIAMAYGSFIKPVTKYSIGTSSFNGKGFQVFDNITMNVLYYSWFLKRFQFKAGFDYYKFNRSWIQVSPTVQNSGYTIEMYHNWEENLLGVNCGLNLDIDLYQDFCIASSLEYRYIFLTDNITRNGMMDFSIGLGYKIQ